MKTHRHLILAILIATPALRAERTQAPIPDFMTSTQVAVWQQERIAKAHAVQAAEAAKTSAPSAFYTGKPYLTESGTYSFLARQYNPEMARWTTVDPSGFPDGANNRVYAAVPTSESDPSGLMSLTGQTNPNPASAAITINGGNYTVTALSPATILSSGSLPPAFEGYTFTQGSSTDAINLSVYKAFVNPTYLGGTTLVDAQGGLYITANIVGTPVANGSWIQIYTSNQNNTSKPLTTTFDNGVNSDPFYAGDPTASSFSDNPQSGVTSATAANPLTWIATDFYVSCAPGSTSITVYGGFTYGYTITE